MLRLRHSWPNLTSFKDQASSKDVNEDPYSFFVSEPTDADGNLSPISLDSGFKKRRPRSFSLSPTRHRLPLDWKPALQPAGKLKKWMKKLDQLHTQRPSSPPALAHPSVEKTMDPIVTPASSPPARGRNQDRSGSMNRDGSRGRSRRKHPRVWQAPNEKLWPVTEEDEAVGLGIEI